MDGSFGGSIRLVDLNFRYSVACARMEARILEHDQAGAGEPPLVLVPGGLTGWDGWLPLVPALSASRRVVRV
ncbi:MAG TPA: hypothetical protein VFD73_09105, partial [Gemmatimonadales bacterium]|nr:hypothetical protein [Gemmatimonadales bacterium]